jgi:hypothetical protein
MRNFSSEYAAEVAKEIAAIFWLVECQFTDMYRWTDADIPLYASGGNYLPRPLRINGLEQAPGFAVDRVNLEVSNVDRVLSALLLGENCAGKPIILSCRAVDAVGRAIATQELFRGILIGWGDLDEQRVPLRLGSEFMLWSKKALRLPTPSCPWVFKKTECAYAGTEDWCDQSPERCDDLENYSNFGGRKYISSIEGKKIYWGPD